MTWSISTIRNMHLCQLVNQGLIEPIGVWKSVNTKIMVIQEQTDFEIIDPQDIFSILSWSTMGTKNEGIYFVRERSYKLRGDGKKVIVPIYP